MVPAVGRSRPPIILATVVLPEPDSPTIARDPPSGSENETSSTAVRGPNSLRRALTSSTDSAMQRHLEAAAQLFCAHASAQAAVERDERRPGLAAYVEGVRAAWCERALAGRRLESRERPAWDRQQPRRGGPDGRPSGRKSSGVGVQRIGVQPARRSDLDAMTG